MEIGKGFMHVNYACQKVFGASNIHFIHNM